MNIKSLIICFAVCLLALAGCKSSQKTVAPGDESSQSDVPWTDVQIPVKVALSNPVKISASGTLSMIYGKSIRLSIKFFGMEVASAYADHDTLVVMTPGVHFAESFGLVSSRTGLTLEGLQTLLLGQKLHGSKEVVPRNEDFLIRRRGTVVASFSFADFCVTQGGPVAGEISATATIGRNQVDALLTTNPRRAQWDRDITIQPLKIPRDSRPCTAEDIFKLVNLNI